MKILNVIGWIAGWAVMAGFYLWIGSMMYRISNHGLDQIFIIGIYGSAVILTSILLLKMALNK